jgi:hypothetical protein
MADERYIKIAYKIRTGKSLKLDSPVTYNEKLQWLKLHDRRPEYIQMVDKYEAKKYVSKIIGDQYIIPTLGVWNHFDEIDFDKLPKQFVLKCTHNSGGNIIVLDKDKLNKRKARRYFEKLLKGNFFNNGREWPYKYVKPRIIAEKYMTDESGIELKDYKVFNFNGEPKFIQVDYGRYTEHKRNLYTTEWKYIDASIEYPTDRNVEIKKPEKLDEMLYLAKKLSEGIPHVRTDFYSINDHIYFGELTFYHGSGMEKFMPESFETMVGSWLELPFEDRCNSNLEIQTDDCIYKDSEGGGNIVQDLFEH